MGRRVPSGPHVAGRSSEAAVEELLAQVVEQTQPHPTALFDDLRGACAIVTGGATGIGRAIVLELARQGAHIAFNYLDDGDGRVEEEAERTAAELRQLEVKVLCRSFNSRPTVWWQPGNYYLHYFFRVTLTYDFVCIWA